MKGDHKMLPPEIIDRLKREEERDESLPVELPLYPSDNIREIDTEEEEKTESRRIIVIDLI